MRDREKSQEAVDLLACNLVLEHIEDDRTVFQRMYTALKPGGVLLISTPSVT